MATSARSERAPRAGRLATIAAVVLAYAGSPFVAAEDRWIALRTPLFGVVSQMSEKDTRRWASEFTQFVEALQALYAIEEPRLAPLTIVLFERPNAFAPYRPVTAAGQARNVDGLFGSRPGWSVIGLAGRQGSRTTRRVIQHEAVHWFASARTDAVPLWFEEGFAEVFSTFDVVDGHGHWGEAIPEHVAYLNARGLQPLDEFLRVSQDEALHDNPTFYPQAWAFVHYFMYGNRGTQRAQLATFLGLLQSETIDNAFTEAFGRTTAELDRELRRYLDGGSYGMSVTDVVDRSGEFRVTPASITQLEFALARLALAGKNIALAKSHAEAVIANTRERAEGYELLAQASFESGDMTGAEGAVARAVALGSEDAALHFLDGQIMLQKHYMEDEWPDRALDADTARAIADSLAKSLTIHPRNRDAIQAFSIALMCVPELTDRDLALLGVALRLYPDNGLPLVVRAAAANRRGDFQTARRLLAGARTEPYSLPPPLRPAATAMGDRWLLDHVSESLQGVHRVEQLDAVEALIATELAAEGTSPSLAKRLESIQADLMSFRRHLQAAEAVERGDLDQASSLYREILADPDAPRSSRRQAERALETIGNGRRPAESRVVTP